MPSYVMNVPCSIPGQVNPTNHLLLFYHSSFFFPWDAPAFLFSLSSSLFSCLHNRYNQPPTNNIQTSPENKKIEKRQETTPSTLDRHSTLDTPTHQHRRSSTSTSTHTQYSYTYTYNVTQHNNTTFSHFQSHLLCLLIRFKYT